MVGLFKKWKKEYLIVKIILFPFWLIGMIIIGQTIPYTLWKTNGTHVRWYEIHRLIAYDALFIIASISLVLSFILKSRKLMLKAVWYDVLANRVISRTKTDTTVSGSIGYKIKHGFATWNEKWEDRLISEYDGGTWMHSVASIEHDEINPKKPKDAVKYSIVVDCLLFGLGLVALAAHYLV